MITVINTARLRYVDMKYWFVLFLFAGKSVAAQEWSAFAGAGIGYDAFLRDKSIETNKNKWPFEAGVSLRGGLAYEAANGFNVFLSPTFGYTRLKMPIPDVKNSGAYFSQLELRLLAGSGPVIHSGDKGNTINPFLQLGAAYFSGTDYTEVGKTDNVVVSTQANDLVTDNWVIIVGAGIEWRFAAIVPSSINFQATYTPLNVFSDPVKYTVQTNTSTYPLAIQGRMLQFLLSYGVHWRFKKKD